MEKFITLTEYNGGGYKVKLNPSRIESMEEFVYHEHTGGRNFDVPVTRITMYSGAILIVRELIHQIDNLYMDDF